MTSVAPMSSPHVLDACSLIAVLRREPGASIVDALLAHSGIVCYAHAVNVCEVYYDFVRSDGIAIAQQAVQDLLTAGVNLREDMDRAFWQQVGELKVNPGKLSLADCFALALAQRLGATLVTSDHHEFDPVAASGLLPVLFIR